MIRFKHYLTESEAKIQMITTKQGDKVWRTFMDNHESYQYDYKNGEEIIRQFDNTNEKYTQWFVNEYIKKNFLLKELEEVGANVEKFDKYKAKFKYQDINKYSYLELEKEIVLIPNMLSKKQLDIIDHELIKNKEAEVFAKEAGFLVIIVNTEKASCFYGRGTEWCTAATDLDSEGRKKNKFDFYTKDGEHLYIVFTPDNKKFQILISKFSDYSDINDVIQIADIHDEYITYQGFSGMYPTFVPIFKKIAKKENSLLFMEFDELMRDVLDHDTDKEAFTKIAKTFKHTKITTDNLIEYVARIKKWSDETNQYMRYEERTFLILADADFNYVKCVSDTSPANFNKFINSFIDDSDEDTYISNILDLIIMDAKMSTTETSKYIKYYLYNSTMFSNPFRLMDVINDYRLMITPNDLFMILKRANISPKDLYIHLWRSIVKTLSARSEAYSIERAKVIFDYMDKECAEKSVKATKMLSLDKGIDSLVQKWYDDKYGSEEVDTTGE